MLNSHFDTTLQIMIQIAVKSAKGDEEVTSESIAKSLGTNAAFVRKIMARLSKANLIHTKRGKSGGVTLQKKASEISLKDIYLVAGDGIKIQAPKFDASSCAVSCSAQQIILKLSKKLESAYLLILGRIKLSHLTKEIKYES